MSKKTYGELLRDPRWQKRRLEALQKADFKCRNCGDGTSTLNVHHKIYRKGADPWDYTDKELQVLCEICHTLEHAILDNLKQLFTLLSIDQLEQLSGYGEGLLVATIAQKNNGAPDAKFHFPSKQHALGVMAALGLKKMPSADVTFNQLVALHKEQQY